MSEAKELTQIMGTRNNENEFRNGEGWKKKKKKKTDVARRTNAP